MESVMRKRCCLAVAVAILAGASRVVVAADSVKLSEPYTDTRPFAVVMRVETQGNVLTVGAAGPEKLPLRALANFQLRERRLPPAGRDAQSMRAIREYDSANLQTDVSGFQNQLELPPNLRLVVASGEREGIRNYAPGTPLTRDASDLLELPGDTLSLLSILPPGDVAVGDTWTPADWAAQMLVGIEAVESSSLTCQLDALEKGQATITFQGSVKGQRLGADTQSDVRGKLVFDVNAQHLKEGVMVFSVKASVGTVNPGLEATVNVQMARQVASSPGRLTDKLLESIPLEAPALASQLTFDASPWGLRILHDRNWHLFQAVFEGQTQIAILRLMERGSLICQCNMSPVPSAPAGEHTPVEQFERDIQASLGPRFGSFTSKDQLPASDGRFIYRIVAAGEVELTKKPTADSKEGATSVKIPMNWIYFLCADRTGRQVSFVFSIEPSLLEQLGTRDRDIVHSVEFFRPVTAAAMP